MATETGESEVIQPRPEWSANAWIKSLAEYEALYKRSIDDPDGYWAERAAELDWTKKWDKVVEWQFEPTPSIKYFLGGELNVSVNCVDRWVDAGKGDKPAIIFEGDAGDNRVFTFAELKDEVSKFANVLKKHGVKKGDRVALYLPMLAELPVVMLACARMGAIHMVVFGGFSAEALKSRIDNCGAKVLICADKGYRGGKTTASKANADIAVAGETTVETVIVIKRVDGDVPMTAGRDVWYHDEMAAGDISADCPPVPVEAEHPLFILYTSGSTGTPKGVLHCSGGYLLYVHDTAKYVFDLHGRRHPFLHGRHRLDRRARYIVYGPLSNGVDQHPVRGSAHRAPPRPLLGGRRKAQGGRPSTRRRPSYARSRGQDVTGSTSTTCPRCACPARSASRSTPSRGSGTSEKVGKGRIPLGRHLVADRDRRPHDRAAAGRHAAQARLGRAPVLRRAHRRAQRRRLAGRGRRRRSPLHHAPLARHDPRHLGRRGRQALQDVYFSMFRGYYVTGDGCAIDADGDHWLKGRIDDVLNVSGHRIGTAEVESALVSHPAVAEAAVVGYPHAIKGTGIYTYITLIEGAEPSDELRKDLTAHVRKVVGPIATPDKMQFAQTGLPKTRSARSCAASCARSPKASSTAWATPQRWPTRPWSRTSSWAPCKSPPAATGSTRLPARGAGRRGCTLRAKRFRRGATARPGTGHLPRAAAALRSTQKPYRSGVPMTHARRDDS